MLARAPAWRHGRHLLAALAFAYLLPAWTGGAAAAERPFPTIVALGGAQPIQTSEGQFTPIVVADHESGGWYGDGTLAASLRTSEINLRMFHRAAESVELGYAARLRVTTEGDGRDLYRKGDRDSGSAFLGDSLAAIAAARLFPEDPWHLELELERMEARFRRDPDTQKGFQLPEDFAQNEARLSFIRVGAFGEDDAEARLSLAAGERERWREWSLDPDAEESARYSRIILHALQPFRREGGDTSKIEAWILTGDRLDLFSGYAVGGLTGRYPVGGYFRNEFRARQAGVLNLSHEWRFAEDRRVSFHADGARVEAIDPGAAAGAADWHTLASSGIGMYYGLRGLGGLPVILRYAEGLKIDEGSKEGHRREIMLILAAGF